MQAEVIQSFPGRPDDEIQTRAIEVGEVIEGDLAAVAVREGWANEVRAAPVDESMGNIEPRPRGRPKRGKA